MPLINHPRELTASFRNRNILAHHFLATIKTQGQSNSETSFITYVMNKHSLYFENFLDSSGLGQRELKSRKTCSSCQKRISVGAKRRGKRGWGW